MKGIKKMLSMHQKSRLQYWVLILLVVSAVFSFSPVHAEAKTQKATYHIKVYRTTYYGSKNAKGEYVFEMPQLTGKSSYVKKINKSLKSIYKESLENKARLKDYTLNSPLWNPTYFFTTKCTVTYNKKNIISFCFYQDWYAGGVHNMSHYGASYNLKTGKKLGLKDVISGDSIKIKNKIVEKFVSRYPTYYTKAEVRASIMSKKWSELPFYLKNGKVIVSFGSYGPIGINGEFPVTLKGNY